MLIRADARQIPLVDGCVQCCVTSPPYWGLRDYGTAQWEGGNPACDHKESREFVNPKNTLGPNGYLPASNAANKMHQRQYRAECGKCGARRIDKQIGLEPTLDVYVQTMVHVFREVWRVLRDDGTLWLNLGDSYHGGGYANHSVNGPVWLAAHGGDRRRSRQQDRIRDNPNLKPKDLVGIPWRVAFALQADGWYLRSDIIWSKPNPMPESVTDRPTKAHEYLFLLAKQDRYYYDAAAIKEQNSDHESGWNRQRASGFDTNVYLRAKVGTRKHSSERRDRVDIGLVNTAEYIGRNKRSVWTVATQPYAEAHFATFPPALIEPCILAGSRPGDLVLDPFIGSGTTGQVAERFMRRWVGCDLAYQHLSKTRTAQRGLRFIDEATA